MSDQPITSTSGGAEIKSTGSASIGGDVVGGNKTNTNVGGAAHVNIQIPSIDMELLRDDLHQTQKNLEQERTAHRMDGIKLRQVQQRNKLLVAVLILFSLGILLLLSKLLGLGLPPSSLTPAPSTSDLTSTTASVPLAYLVGLRYIADDYAPRLIDLRTAPTEGIWVQPGHALQLDNLVVAVSDADPRYTAQIEVYADSEKIGYYTATKQLNSDRLQWGKDELVIEKYNHGNYSTTWAIQPGWKNIRLAVVTYLAGNPVKENWTSIRLDSKGTSWMYDPPYIKLASLVYTVNAGPPLVLNVPEALQKGINVNTGDQLALREVWYSTTDSNKPQTIRFEALLVKDDYDPSTFQKTSDENIQVGTHKLSSFTPMTWTVTADRKYLDLKFVRGDRTIIDPIRIPLNPGENSGLIPESDAMLWPFSFVRYTDFETSADLASWEGDVGIVGISDAQSFTGKHSLAITMPAGTTSGVLANWDWEPPLQAEAVVGQVYWPEQPGTHVAYAQICSAACASIPIQRGHWHTFIINLSDLSYNGQQLNEQKLSRIWIQAQVDKADQTPYTFYVDGLQIFYPDNQ